MSQNDDSGDLRAGTSRRGVADLLDSVDEALAARVAVLSADSQRWLKTAIHAISTSPALVDQEERGEEARGRPSAAPAEGGSPLRTASLEDVISGKTDLRKHLKSYPELAEELDGLADIIDMLRDLGERRRRTGERILREEILGEPPQEQPPEGYEEEL